MSETTYTESAMVDRVKEYILSKKEQIKIIEYLGSRGRGIFMFNPSDATQEIQDIFLMYADDFRLVVKRVISELVAEWYDDDRARSVMNNVNVIITTNTRIKLNEWSSDFEGVPVAAKCQIVGSLKEETYTKNAECICTKCKRRTRLINNELPTVCENESCTGRKFVIDSSTLKTGDIKTIIIQEPMDEIKHGIPKLLTCIVKDDLVFDAYPGQQKIITGVFHSTPKKNTDRNSIFIHAISMQNLDDDILKLPTNEMVEYYKEQAKKENYMKLITDSFAPEIKFREIEKLAVIISRVGSKKNGRIRGNIHTLLIGPPATAKSKILEFLPEVTQRCGIATGGMSTGSGITVTMTTLPDKTKFPKGGIVVQCSGSCVVLDELNQFPEEDIGKTYTAMESGKIPYNKGGFDQVFIADTTIIAGANPKNGYYHAPLGMVKNINLPKPMISRFDIIINVLPESSEIQSQQISDHTYMIKELGVEKYIKENKLLNSENLTELFNYASTLTTTFSPDAKVIIDDYVKVMMKLQQTGDQIEGSKQFDRRFIESIQRVSEALTKIHFQTVITKEFAIMAIEYIKKTLETFGLKTDLGVTTIPLENMDLKDKHLAFEQCWMQMCKDADNQLLPEYDFLKYLFEQHPKLFPTMDKASKIFKEKHDKGDLIYENGRYRMTK